MKCDGRGKARLAYAQLVNESLKEELSSYINLEVVNLKSAYLDNENQLWLGGINVLSKIDLNTLKPNEAKAYSYFDFAKKIRKGFIFE